MTSRFSAVRWLGVLLALGVAVVLSACSSTALDTTPTALDTTQTALDTTPTALDSTQSTAGVSSLDTAPPSTPAASVRYSDLPTITLNELPDEALETLRLIRDDGPYPYSQDGSTFQNREGILPDEPRGHYQEFTVDTPGLSHRGARRFVHGADGALYYTDDHYSSFRELVSS